MKNKRINYEEYISWLEKEITKEDVRVNNEETKTGIRRWVLSIMKNMILSNPDIVSDEQNISNAPVAILPPSAVISTPIPSNSPEFKVV